VWVIEVTWNPTREQWHPHAHCLIDGGFWHQGKIADLWEGVTGDSRVVDVRLIRSRKNAVNYIAKYISKGGDIKRLPDDRIAEYAVALSGVRLIQTFGVSHGIKKDQETPEKATEIHVVNDFQFCHAKADLGHAEAHRTFWNTVEAAEKLNDKSIKVILHDLAWIADPVAESERIRLHEIRAKPPDVLLF
jgi:hypothetical protein